MYAVSAGSCLRAIPSFRNRAEDLDGGVHGDVFHDPPGIEDGQPHTPVGTGSNTEEIGLVGDIGSVRLGGDTAEEEDPMMEEAGVTPGSHTLPRIEERVPPLRLDLEGAPRCRVVHTGRSEHGVQGGRPGTHMDTPVLDADHQFHVGDSVQIRIGN